MGFRVWGSGFRVYGLRFRVWGLGFRVGFRQNVDSKLLALNVNAAAAVSPWKKVGWK